MIGTIGDLVEDIAVQLQSQVHVASDTHAFIDRRQGGSAANAAVAVARLRHPARFIGQVGDDAVGQWLTDSLGAQGVQCAVRRSGRSGTIVLLLDAAGERTMLTDRGACTLLADPVPAWLAGLSMLHVPLYSLVGEPLATTTYTLVTWARERGVRVSLDASSASVIADCGSDRTISQLASLHPDFLFCNELEAEALGGVDAALSISARITIIKRGAGPTTLVERGASPVDIAVPRIEGVVDTTGAGDAFAAGFLVASTKGATMVDAVSAGHASARAAITSFTSPS